MTTVRAPFPDVEMGLVEWLPTQISLTGDLAGLSKITAGLVTNSSLTENLLAGDGVIRISSLSGPDDRITATPQVDIETFALTRALGYALAEQIRGIMLDTPHRMPGMIVDNVRTTSGPRWVPWSNSKIRRHLATYRVSVRR